MLVTDYRMEGMNGLELAGLIRQNSARNFRSSSSPDIPPEQGSDEVNAWLDKPVDIPGTLLEKIRLVAEPRRCEPKDG